MPANTVNRLYPYSVPGDPADVPAALQSLAEAIDDDVCALINGVTGRPVAQFRGTGQYHSFTTSLGAGFPPQLPFDVEEFDTANVTLQSQELGNRLVFPEDPGFYFALAMVQVPTSTHAVPMDMLVSITKGDITSPATPRTRLAVCSHNINVSPDDRDMRLFTLSTQVFMNGTTDGFSVEFFADSTPDVTEYVIAERRLTILKMTQS